MGQDQGRDTWPAVDFPPSVAPTDPVQPVPRRIRGVRNGVVVFDTTRATYVWEHARYPQYWVPLDDITPGLLVAEGHTQQSPWGTVESHALEVSGEAVPRAAKVVVETSHPRLDRAVRFQWAALDAWFEEDEQVHVHPRSPYVRVDCLRSTRSVRVELVGTVLAETSAPVMLFETGLPTRYYILRTDVRLDRLIPSATETACPYKGTTTQYWSANVGGTRSADVAWSYDYPYQSVAPIAGLIAFYNEKVDLYIDGRRLDQQRGG